MAVSVKDRELVGEEFLVGQGEQGSAGLDGGIPFSDCCGTSSTRWSLP